MPRVVLSAFEVARFERAPGHLWVYLQYVAGLRAAGAEVWWLERLPADRAPELADRLAARLAPFGLPRERLLLYTEHDGERRWLGHDPESAGADLLLNFHYELGADLLTRFPRTALVDIDPGLLQLWVSRGELTVADHDVWFTTGETVGTPAARFPDCGHDWVHIRPPVALDEWAVAPGDDTGAFTTISSWWADEWVVDGDDSYDNNKRVGFLTFAALPRRTDQALELALSLGPGDRADVTRLRTEGWRVRDALDVAGTADAYRAYVSTSRGEFSCAKPSCMRLQNAWVSDRTLCYLASGRPAVLQHTGPNPCLDGGEGVLRFTTVEEAAAALEAVSSDYGRHRRAARAIVEEHFDARKVAARILERALP